MEKVGVIAEYNPFHNGHLYHLNKVKEMFPNGYYILILIGNFTQRGEISVINKWDKTKIALEYGYDLIIELPYLFATQAANFYAKGAIDILNYLKCDYLVFGSETNDINLLEKLTNLTYNNNEYEKLIKKYINKGYNYPTSLSLALNDISKVIIDKPNDVLALEYVRQIKNTNSKIKPISIKRTSNYHEKSITGNVTSATSIRKNIKNKDLIKDVMPNNIINYIDNINYEKYFEIVKYQIISSNNLNEYIGVDEGIENKFKKIVNKSSNIDELILNAKSKRYSYNRIQRILLHIACKDKKDNNEHEIKYIRVLGMNNNGKKILKEVKKDINIPIITKFKKEYESLFKEDLKASKIYSLISNYDDNEEFRSSIYINK